MSGTTVKPDQALGSPRSRNRPDPTDQQIHEGVDCRPPLRRTLWWVPISSIFTIRWAAVPSSMREVFLFMCFRFRVLLLKKDCHERSVSRRICKILARLVDLQAEHPFESSAADFAMLFFRVGPFQNPPHPPIGPKTPQRFRLHFFSPRREGRPVSPGDPFWSFRGEAQKVSRSKKRVRSFWEAERMLAAGLMFFLLLWTFPLVPCGFVPKPLAQGFATSLQARQDHKNGPQISPTQCFRPRSHQIVNLEQTFACRSICDAIPILMYI